MKHYFIINPVSGKNNTIDPINDVILPAVKKTGVEYEIYETTAQGDGTRFVKEICEKSGGEPVRFYSVGGDGTLYEVINGAYGYPNAEITVVPKGSGNDYIRLFGTPEQFLNVENLINGKVLKVDGLRVDDYTGNYEYAINQASMGFDAETCARQSAMKAVPGAIGHVTYLLAGLYCMFTHLINNFKCTIDGVEQKGPFVQCMTAVSHWYGSGIEGAPFADPTDGKLDFVVWRRNAFWPVIFKVGLIDWQTKGTHVYKSYVDYLRGDKVEFEALKPVYINVDGECRRVQKCSFETVPGAFNFVIPADTYYYDKKQSGEFTSEIKQGKYHKEPLCTLANKCKPFDWTIGALLRNKWK